MPVLSRRKKKLIRQRQIPINPTLEATIRKEVEKLIIAHIKYSEWVSTIVHVWKKYNDIRLCIDFCVLNRASVKDNFPHPNMELILQQVAGSQMISLLDGFSGYNQVRVKRDDKYKTTFTTHWSTFYYERIPFGLINVVDTF